MKKSTMFLLWLGAAISISEIFTGGLLAPLGLGKGLAVIVAGHLIGCGLLAFGAYVSYSRGQNAMGSVRAALGPHGGALAAFCNVLQLIGWTIIMIVQAASALVGLLPGFSFSLAALILSGLILLWALLFGSPIGRLNDLAVVLLLLVCLVFFGQTVAGEAKTADVSQYISLALAMELSITMPVSWLPLIGDYSHKAGDKNTAVTLPFLGYFLGSVFMYSLGLVIALNSGGNIFEFIAQSSLAWPACAVVLLSTLTTAFLDLYSAAVSATALIRFKNERIPILAIGLLAAALTVFFPVERYSDVLINFLSTIGLVFVPVYAVLFMNFIVAGGGKTRPGNLVIALAGMGGYYLFGRFEIGIPTLSTLILVSALCLIKHGVLAKALGANRA